MLEDTIYHTRLSRMTDTQDVWTQQYIGPGMRYGAFRNTAIF